MARSPILGGFSTAISPNVADNICVNLNVEVVETKDGIVPGFLRGASGLDLIGALGSFVLTGGEIGNGGSGYAQGDIIYLLPGGGTWTSTPIIRVKTVSGGSVTEFDVTSPGSYTVKPTIFTQQATSGTGAGFALILPDYQTGGPVRGLLPLNDILYIVTGPEVWSLTPNGIATLLSSPTNQLSDAGTPVSMFKNTTQLMIVDGVDAWLVPGGYPLVGGVMEKVGGLYEVGDTIILQADTGEQTAYPELRVDAVNHNQVWGYKIPNMGTGYVTGTTATSGIQPNPGGGTGLRVAVEGFEGHIIGIAVVAGGSGYTLNNTGRITAGAGDGVYMVTAVSGSSVTSVIVLNPGTNYADGIVSGIETSGPDAFMRPNKGVGLTFNITALGFVYESSILDGGRGYQVSNCGYLSAGNGDATYVITDVSPIGGVTGFTITKPGAIKDKALRYTQRSTSGSGSGFIFKEAIYGGFVSLVPIDVPFPSPIKGAVSDGFGLLIFRFQQYLAASDQGDLSTWRPLSFGLCNQSPDNCVSMEVIHNNVMVLKEKSGEVWVDGGLENFPFQPITSTHMEFGCVATFSVAIVDSELIWLSRNDQGEGVVVSAKAYNPVPISTQALTNELQTYANIGDAIAYGRQEGQHSYYVITFPEANKTWQYDKTSSEMAGFPIWTELAALPENFDGTLDRHWGNAFTPWTGTIALQPTTYQPLGVTITAPTELVNNALGWLPPAFSSFVFSVWLYMPEDAGHGVIFTNQDDIDLYSTNPGIFIRITNDTLDSGQLNVAAWDGGNGQILYATYFFTEWSDWVNIQVSVSSTTNQISVYANTLSGGTVNENYLSGSVSWFSAAQMANPGGYAWRVIPVEG